MSHDVHKTLIQALFLCYKITYERQLELCSVYVNRTSQKLGYHAITRQQQCQTCNPFTMHKIAAPSSEYYMQLWFFSVVINSVQL